MTASEARALEDAAQMLDKQQLPVEALQPGSPPPSSPPAK
jgi:hypothetical protein